MKQNPLVSVNIRTYNSGKTLEATLKSVENQSYKNIEIVISDGHSKDSSVVIAKKYKARVAYSDNLGDARYQNYRNSKGKYVVSLDSDQLMDKKLIETCVDYCEKQGFDALIISEKSLINKGNYLENLIAFDKWLIDKNRDIDPIFGTACPRFFRKDLLRNLNWPKHLGIFDDTILYAELLKNKARVKYVTTQSIRHYEVTSWVTLAKKFFRYGKSYFSALKANPTAIAAHSLPRKSYFSKAALSKPKFFFGLPLLYLVKIGAALFGMFSYLFSADRN